MKINEIVDDASRPFIITSKTKIKDIPITIRSRGRSWKVYKLSGDKLEYHGSSNDLRSVKEWLRDSTSKDKASNATYLTSQDHLDDVEINTIKSLL